MTSKIDKRLLWWVFSATVGGPVRTDIVRFLKDIPSNPNQIAMDLNLSYPTIRHHLKILKENKMVESTKTSNITMYSLTADMEETYPEFLKIVDILEKRKKR